MYFLLIFIIFIGIIIFRNHSPKPSKGRQTHTRRDGEKVESINKEKDCNSAGWDAIEHQFLSMYPTQDTPLHYGTLIAWEFGGNDPLDGISVYDAGDFYHFVTLGFSELYDKKSENEEWSGYGFELTLKLKKCDVQHNSSDIITDEKELKGMASSLQKIARYVFTQNIGFEKNEYLYTGQTDGIDVNSISQLTGFIIKDSGIETLNTENGKVQFLELIGVTDKELKVLVAQKASHEEVEKFIDKYHIDTMYTDYNRMDII